MIKTMPHDDLDLYKITDDDIYDYQGAGLIIVRCLQNDKTYIGNSTDLQERLKTILRLGTMPSELISDREKYRKLDDSKVWDIGIVIALVKDSQKAPSRAELNSLKHNMIMKYNCLHPNGYNHNTGQTFSKVSKLKRALRKKRKKTIKETTKHAITTTG